MEPLVILFLAIRQHVTHPAQASFRLIVIPNHCLFIFAKVHMIPLLPLVPSPFLKISHDQVTCLSQLFFGLYIGLLDKQVSS